MGSSYALWQLGRYDEGYALATKAIQFGPNVLSLSMFVANAVLAGRLEEALQAVKQMLNVASHLRVADVGKTCALRDAILREKFVACFRDAGLPEN